MGTVIWCYQHQLTKDRQSYQLVLIFTLKASTTIYFKEIEQLHKPLIWNSSLIQQFKASNKHLTVELYLLLCILFRLICGACGGNKCHWCIVAIVERRNRLQGISHRRSVGSSCIGWLSCMLEQSSQRYHHTSTGSAWEKVQTFSPCLHGQQNHVRIRPKRGSVSPTTG